MGQAASQPLRGIGAKHGAEKSALDRKKRYIVDSIATSLIYTGLQPINDSKSGVGSCSPLWPTAGLIAEAERTTGNPICFVWRRNIALIQTSGQLICFAHNRRREKDTYAEGEKIIDSRDFATTDN